MTPLNSSGFIGTSPVDTSLLAALVSQEQEHTCRNSNWYLPSNHFGSISPTLLIRYDEQPNRSANSFKRVELELLGEPTTRSKSHSTLIVSLRLAGSELHNKYLFYVAL